jgi:hypothetical protein
MRLWSCAEESGTQRVRRLLADEVLLQDDPLTGGAEAAIDHRLAHGVLCQAAILGNHHALARREAVGLDDDRESELLAGDRRVRCLERVTRPKARRRHAVTGHEVLGECLARLEPCRRLRRPDDRAPLPGEEIDDATTERQLRAHDRQVHAFPRGDRQQLRRLAGVDRDATRHVGSSRITRCAENCGHVALAGQLPGHCMLAGSAADNENLHGVRLIACMTAGYLTSHVPGGHVHEVANRPDYFVDDGGVCA